MMRATGAFPLKVIVPTEGFPPITLTGARPSVVGPGGNTARIAENLPAVILAVFFVATGMDEIAKVAVFDPAGTFTNAGIPSEGSDLVRVTLNPAAGAATVRVTVPFAGAPPVTLVGATESPLTVWEKTREGMMAEASRKSNLTTPQEVRDIRDRR